MEIEFIRLDIHPPGNRVSVSNRNFFKNWNSTFGLAQSTLCHLVSLSRLPCPDSVTQSSLSRLPSTLSSHASPSTLCHASVTAPPSQRLRHSASPQRLATLTPLSLWQLSDSPSPPVKYDFVIVWFVRLGLWFLFQIYGFRVLLMLFWWIITKKKNVGEDCLK